MLAIREGKQKQKEYHLNELILFTISWKSKRIQVAKVIQRGKMFCNGSPSVWKREHQAQMEKQNSTHILSFSLLTWSSEEPFLEVAKWTVVGLLPRTPESASSRILTSQPQSAVPLGAGVLHSFSVWEMTLLPVTLFLWNAFRPEFSRKFLYFYTWPSQHYHCIFFSFIKRFSQE